MDWNAVWSVVLGLVVFVLGWVIKRFDLQLEDRRMAWTIVVLSVVLGAMQTAVTAQVERWPAAPAGAPDEVVFVWLPQVVKWAAGAAVVILAASQTVWFTLKKLLALRL